LPELITSPSFYAPTSAVLGRVLRYPSPTLQGDMIPAIHNHFKRTTVRATKQISVFPSPTSLFDLAAYIHDKIFLLQYPAYFLVINLILVRCLPSPHSQNSRFRICISGHFFLSAKTSRIQTTKVCFYYHNLR
jgi:hypothetical protein